METAGRRSLVTRLELTIWDLIHSQFNRQVTGLVWYQLYWQIRSQVRNDTYPATLDQAKEDTDGSRRD